jgi:hypothetical protein
MQKVDVESICMSMHCMNQQQLTQIFKHAKKFIVQQPFEDDNKLIKFVNSIYPHPDHRTFSDIASHNPMNWRQFVIAVSESTKKNFGHRTQPLTIRMSSTYAVCQEYLGTLSCAEDAQYTVTQNGIWSIVNNDTVSCTCYPYDNSTVVTVRQVIDVVKERFP